MTYKYFKNSKCLVTQYRQTIYYCEFTTDNNHIALGPTVLNLEKKFIKLEKLDEMRSK